MYAILFATVIPYTSPLLLAESSGGSPVCISYVICQFNNDKFVLVQAMKAYGGVKLYIHIFITAASDALHALAILHPEKAFPRPPPPSPVNIEQKVVWTLQPVWTPCRNDKSLVSSRSRTMIPPNSSP